MPQGVNVIVPLGKLSKQMKAEGFTKPLQFTSLLGRPLLFWLIDNLNLREQDVIFLAINASEEAVYQLYSSTCAEYSSSMRGVQIKLVPLMFRTCGVVETLVLVTKYMSEREKSRQTVVLNGDTIFKFDVLSFIRNFEGSSLCFMSRLDIVKPQQDNDVNWLFCSCVPASPSNLDMNPAASFGLRDILEVRQCSSPGDLVCIGAYGFSSGLQLEQICVSALGTLPEGQEQDYSFRGLISSALNQLEQMRGYEINGLDDSFIPLKTRQMLDSCIRGCVKSNWNLRPVRPSRYIFEMYGGLLDKNDVPRQHVVSATQTLKRLGHNIIVSSNRGRSCSSINTLVSLLEQMKVPYDELEFCDNPCGQESITIGASVVDARSDLCSALGIPSNNTPNELQIKARHFNTVVMKESSVMKTSTISILEGEAAYYERIPEELSHMFPTLLSKGVNGDEMTIEITRINGLNCSQVLVNRYMDPEKLQGILDSLFIVHGFGTFHEHAEVNFYSNYADKVNSRFNEFQALYRNISEGCVHMRDVVLQLLEEYEQSNRADLRSYVHGDPVLSNCMILGKSVYFFDMNGKQGKFLTTKGDCAYDLAKVLQSLWGYDYIILDIIPDERDEDILQELREQYFTHVSKRYRNISKKDVEMICASLLFSLIPLHENTEHRVRFYELCKRVLNSAIDREAAE